MELLLQYGADRHVTDRQGRTVAELAAAAGHAGALGDLLTIDTPRGTAEKKRSGTQNKSPAAQAAAAASSSSDDDGAGAQAAITPAPAGMGGGGRDAAMSRWSRAREAATASRSLRCSVARKMGKAGGGGASQSPPIIMI